MANLPVRTTSEHQQTSVAGEPARMRADPFRPVVPWSTGDQEPARFKPDFMTETTDDGFVFQADLAGIKEGDIVTAWDGIPIRTSDELLMRVRRSLPYSTITISIVRPGEGEGAPVQKLDIPVKMGKQ